MNEIINVIIAKADTVVKRSALILGEPDVPELIAIQALSILGKEKMALDIPVSTCKGMERFYSMFGTWRVGYSEKVKAIRNVQSYVDLDRENKGKGTKGRGIQERSDGPIDKTVASSAGCVCTGQKREI